MRKKMHGIITFKMKKYSWLVANTRFVAVFITGYAVGS